MLERYENDNLERQDERRQASPPPTPGARGCRRAPSGASALESTRRAGVAPSRTQSMMYDPSRLLRRRTHPAARFEAAASRALCRADARGAHLL
mmetsp:Transcript_13511/g.47039  ORF Transcript_13511/g.47039 Transcript_13511/m.47039 type:complete len:94 (-) Transcript_13511:40-321(-)